MGASANNTFFHKGASVYDGKYVSGAISPGLGVSIPVNFNLSPAWSLRSGVAVHVKRYRVIMSGFDAPFENVRFFFESPFASPEIPIIIAFKNPREKKYKFEYRLGVVNTLNIPLGTSHGYSYEGIQDAPIMEIYIRDFKKRTYYSPDLYVAVGLLNMVNGGRRHEFTLSYQYGFGNVQSYELFAIMANPDASREMHVRLTPTISSFMLSYNFYPRQLKWGHSEPPADVGE